MMKSLRMIVILNSSETINTNALLKNKQFFNVKVVRTYKILSITESGNITLPSLLPSSLSLTI